MRMSVVIPVFNGGPNLEKCLAALGKSTYPVFECILVDDASTDGMVNPAAERAGARVIRLDTQSGPAIARNHGVKEARGDIIFFTDADVLLRPDALAEAAATLTSDPGLDAVFGSYDNQPGHKSFISQYRTLFHHWVHQTSSDEASTFWSGCGAIRRDVFLKIGGFSHDYERPSIEDIELGVRLRRSGHRIRLLKNMYGKHMKQWEFWHLIRTDVLLRAVPWMLIILREGQLINDLNLSYRSRIATLLAALMSLSLLILALTGHGAALLPTTGFLLAAVFSARLSRPGNRYSGKNFLAITLATMTPLASYLLTPDPLALAPLTIVCAIITTHLPFYRYVAQKRGIAFAIAVVPMQLIFFLGCSISIPVAFIQHQCATRWANTDAEHLAKASENKDH